MKLMICALILTFSGMNVPGQYTQMEQLSKIEDYNLDAKEVLISEPEKSENEHAGKNEDFLVSSQMDAYIKVSSRL
ncbi:MAG: hypothetical protein WBD24_04320 [Candidatus Omnitrophota bacterium]